MVPNLINQKLLHGDAAVFTPIAWNLVADFNDELIASFGPIANAQLLQLLCLAHQSKPRLSFGESLSMWQEFYSFLG